MAVTHSSPGKLFEMTAAADQTTLPLFVKNVRVTGDATTIAGIVTLVDPITTTKILWRTNTSGVNYAEADGVEAYWPNGFRVGTFGITSGIVSVRYD